MPRSQCDSALVDQMTRLKLKLLRKRLENKTHSMDNRTESAKSARTYDGQFDQLLRALWRKQVLLQRLQEQHMFEDPHRPLTWGGSQRQYKSAFCTAPQPPPPLPLYKLAPVLTSLHPPPLASPQPPHIIQQILPHRPATIIQQLSQQQPLITQIPLSQPYPAPWSGGIKEGMVELMLMQNAQMHQIIMHNMVLKAMPPMFGSSHGGPSPCAHLAKYQGTHQGNPIFVRPDVQPRGSADHYEHCGPNPVASQLPPIGQSAWLPAGQEEGHQPSIDHDTPAPFTLPPLKA